MARYIDADKFREIAFYADTEADINHYIRLYGYADVVPKSQVEQLKRDLEQCENGYSQALHLERCKLADEQSKIREIFEEIEKNSKFTIQLVEAMEFDSEEIRKAKLECYRDCMGYFQKLKKKYTESERN